MSRQKVMPYRKGNFLVVGTIAQGKRTILTCVCPCGKLSEYRSDSSIFVNRKDCGLCFNSYSMRNDECHIDVFDSCGQCHTLNISSHRIGMVKRFVKGKIWVARSVSGRTIYAYCTSSENSSELFHRSLFSLSGNEVVDHIDGDGLNCCDYNCRVVDKTENNRNLPRMKTNTSGVTGVSKLDGGRYRAYIWNDGCQISLGKYDSLFDAVCARKSGEIRFGYHFNHGRTSNSNEPI